MSDGTTNLYSTVDLDTCFMLNISSASTERHFGLASGSLIVNGDNVPGDVSIVDGKLRVPTNWCVRAVRDKWTTTIQCQVQGDDADSSDERNPMKDPGHAGQSQQKETGAQVLPSNHVLFDHAEYQDKYNFLRYNTRPASAPTVQSFQNFRREVHRRYRITSRNELARRVTPWEIDHRIQNEGRLLRTKSSPEVICVPTKQAMVQIINERHYRGHDRRDRLEWGLRQHYAFRGMRFVINDVLADCERCAEHAVRVPKTVQSITTSRNHEIVMYDLFTMGIESEEGHIHVLLMKDHFSKYHWGKAFSSKDAGPIAAYLLEHFTTSPVPEQVLPHVN